MTSAYKTFKSFLWNLVSLEATERNTLNREGYRNHFNIDDDTLATLQSLAADVVNSEDVDDVNDLQREVVAFVLHVNVCEFNHFLQNLNARYYVHEIFYPQCVGEYCYKKFPVAEWVAETFAADDAEEEAEEEAVETEEQEKISAERATLCSRAAMNLMNALNRRDGVNLAISRPGDEPMAVNVDDLLSLSSFDSRVEFIGNMNGEDVETVEKCLATGRLSFFDDPDDDDDFDDDDDDDDDDGAISDPLTWEAILSNPRLSCPETCDDERDGREVDENPRWLRSLRREFVVTTVRIESARRNGDDKLESMIRADALDTFLHTAVEHDLTLTAWYWDRPAPINNAIATFCDALNASGIVDESYKLVDPYSRCVHRRASLNHKRHVAAVRFLARASDETMRLLYEAIAEGLDLNIKVSGSYINLVG